MRVLLDPAPALRSMNWPMSEYKGADGSRSPALRHLLVRILKLYLVFLITLNQKKAINRHWTISGQ